MPDAIAIWSNDGTIADHPHVPATPPPPDQGCASALPSSASTGPVKAVAVARSVRGIPRSGDMSTDSIVEDTVALVVYNPYHSRWVMEW